MAKNMLFNALSQSLPPCPNKTSQLSAIPGREADMVQNNAGGVGFQVSPETRLLRDLILGNGDGYYKAGAVQVAENIESLNNMIASGRGLDALVVVRSVYLEGRAPRQDTTMLALAILSRCDDLEVRRAAFALVQEFRTLSQLYSFKAFHSKAGHTKGWGRLAKNAFCGWVQKHDAVSLAYQSYKYGQREGWTLRDLMRCCHLNANSLTPDRQLVLKSVVRGFDEAFQAFDQAGEDQALQKVSTYLHAVQELKGMTNKSNDLVPRICELVQKHRLPREMLPTWALNFKDVWLTLLLNEQGQVTMPMTALIRNLGVMTARELFFDYDVVAAVCNKLRNMDALRAARVHPVAILTALFTYKQGRGTKGSLTWEPHPDIVRALDDAFYRSFGTLKPTGKRIFHAFDGSGSMTMQIPCLPIMTACQAVAVLGMCFSRAEDPRTQDFAVFSHDSSVGASRYGGYYGYGRSSGLRRMVITPTMKLEESAKITQITDWAGTDCSLPITKALEEFRNTKGSKGKYDVFIIYTDNDTWAGNVHPSQALKEYRRVTGIHDAKMVVVATTASNVSIADPNDPNMLDIVGFDANAPKILTDFVSGDLFKVLTEETSAEPSVEASAGADDGFELI